MDQVKTEVDTNETVMLDLDHVSLIELDGKITSCMEKRGLNPYDFKSLDLGFELPAGWPIDADCRPTQAQLVVLAVKLDLQIVIEKLYVTERKHDG